MTLTITDLAKNGGGVFQTFGFLYYVSCAASDGRFLVYEIAAYTSTGFVFYPSPKESQIDRDIVLKPNVSGIYVAAM